MDNQSGVSRLRLRQGSCIQLLHQRHEMLRRKRERERGCGRRSQRQTCEGERDGGREIKITGISSTSHSRSAAAGMEMLREILNSTHSHHQRKESRPSIMKELRQKQTSLCNQMSGDGIPSHVSD